ncbi:MAG: OmpH family outer membrane protein [Melioribacteraceae bacterium]|nr:OmpH family outer membrane protein [Melioribacteraceae bacterium]MCF8357040.1 OmpH family outer membrane protein [Melioribacteraceae bacterium]MCF8396485.1 OmpH family outer membrane protein [Melioribacteraceae bacterium]
MVRSFFAALFLLLCSSNYFAQLKVGIVNSDLLLNSYPPAVQTMEQLRENYSQLDREEYEAAQSEMMEPVLDMMIKHVQRIGEINDLDLIVDSGILFTAVDILDFSNDVISSLNGGMVPNHSADVQTVRTAGFLDSGLLLNSYTKYIDALDRLERDFADADDETYFQKYDEIIQPIESDIYNEIERAALDNKADIIFDTYLLAYLDDSIRDWSTTVLLSLNGEEVEQEKPMFIKISETAFIDNNDIRDIHPELTAVYNEYEKQYDLLVKKLSELEQKFRVREKDDQYQSEALDITSDLKFAKEKAEQDIAEITERITMSIGEIAKTNSFKLVFKLGESGIVYIGPGIKDITGQVLRYESK